MSPGVKAAPGKAAAAVETGKAPAPGKASAPAKAGTLSQFAAKGAGPAKAAAPSKASAPAKAKANTQFPPIPSAEASRCMNVLQKLATKLGQPQALQEYQEDKRKFYWEVLSLMLCVACARH